GIIAEFDDPDCLLAAARRVRQDGYRALDAFSPHEILGLDEALGIHRTPIPAFALSAALTGVAFAYGVQSWCNATDYRIDVGGRPFNSIPTHGPIMFETAVLFAALTVFVLTLLFSRLPRLHFDMSEIDGFERTSVDRYWLTLGYPDPGYHR